MCFVLLNKVVDTMIFLVLYHEYYCSILSTDKRWCLRNISISIPKQNPRLRFQIVITVRYQFVGQEWDSNWHCNEITNTFGQKSDSQSTQSRDHESGDRFTFRSVCVGKGRRKFVSSPREYLLRYKFRATLYTPSFFLPFLSASSPSRGSPTFPETAVRTAGPPSTK